MATPRPRPGPPPIDATARQIASSRSWPSEPGAVPHSSLWPGPGSVVVQPLLAIDRHRLGPEPSQASHMVRSRTGGVGAR